MKHLGTLAGWATAIGCCAQPIVITLPERPFGISADGTTVVGDFDAGGDFCGGAYLPLPHASLWTLRGGMLDLGFSIGTAYGCSADGSVVVGGLHRPFRWSAGNSFELGVLPGTTGGHAVACSDDGDVIVGDCAYEWTEDKCMPPALLNRAAFRWTPAEGLVPLGWPDGWTTVSAVSANGSSAAGVGNPVYVPPDNLFSPAVCYRWTAGDGVAYLDDSPGIIRVLSALAMTPNARTIVGQARSVTGWSAAYRWDSWSGVSLLGDWHGGNAAGTSDAGEIIVGSYWTGVSTAAFIWTRAGGMMDLRAVLVSLGATGIENLPNLADARALSADGRAVIGRSDGGAAPYVVYLETTHRASVSQTESPGNADSGGGSISGDGNLVAFQSDATNLVPGDTNGATDIFVRNRASGWTNRDSVSAAGAQANGRSFFARITPNGRWVVFVSTASNLVPDDTNGKSDVFVRDRWSGAVERVSLSSAGAQANSDSDLPNITPDGRWVVFQSSASDLVPGDTNGVGDIFLRDRQTGQTTRLSVNTAGQQANGPSYGPSVSNSGLAIAFSSDATNLDINPDANNARDVFLRNLYEKTTAMVSRDNLGNQFYNPSQSARISGNGRYVMFTNVDNGSLGSVYLLDRAYGYLTPIDPDAKGLNGDSLPLLGVGLSTDGRYILLNSTAQGLVRGDNNGATDAFLYDRTLDDCRRVSLGVACLPCNRDAYGGSISPDGRWVTFTTPSPDLVESDNDGFNDVFVRELWQP